MTDLPALEKRLDVLEARVSKLEEKVALMKDDDELMEAFYVKAKELVVKHQEASVPFLQKKFSIDMARSTKLIARLEAEGIIGPETGIGRHEVLVK